MRLYPPNQILMSDVISINILLISKKLKMILFHKRLFPCYSQLLFDDDIWYCSVLDPVFHTFFLTSNKLNAH